MSKLKISPNLFLEVAELQRLVKFLKGDGYELLIKSMLKTYGIVQTADNNYFKVTLSGALNTIIINKGIAIDSQLRAIVMEKDLILTVQNTGSKRWVILEYDSTNYEKGTVSVTANGTLQGVGTSFTEVLRGQPNFPTKVKLNSSLNVEEYEVVSVTNDNSAVIAGSFNPESNVQYAVVGAFTPGFEPNEENRLIYEMDSYKITIVDSADVPSLTADQYVLASIEFAGNGIIITDQRAGYMFNGSSYTSGGIPTSDELVSLLQVQKITNNMMEITIEHGYTITNFELITTSTFNIFRIRSGSCNFLGTGNIPNGLFKNWILVNAETFKSVIIDNNENKDLYISNLDEELLQGTVTKFFVLPPYENIEYEILYSGESVVNSLPRNTLASQGSNVNKILLPAPYGDLTVSLRYRMINGDTSTPKQKFAIAEYINENGEKQIIGDSQFFITFTEPVVELRNYS